MFIVLKDTTIKKNNAIKTTSALLVAATLAQKEVLDELTAFFAKDGVPFMPHKDVAELYLKVDGDGIKREFVSGYVTEINQVKNGHPNLYKVRLHGIDVPKDAVLSPIYKSLHEVHNGEHVQRYTGLFGFTINDSAGFLQFTDADDEVKGLVKHITAMNAVVADGGEYKLKEEFVFQPEDNVTKSPKKYLHTITAKE